MTKRKDANPFNEGAPYSEILGVDPSAIRKKVRRRGDSDQDQSLLTSTDLFGDIIDDFTGDRAVGRDNETPPPKKSPPLDPRIADTDPYAGNLSPDPNKSEQYSLLDAAYSTLLQDSHLHKDVERLESIGDTEDGASEYGRYVLLERVAVGGMAEVFRAKRKGVEGFEKVVAVKRILPDLSKNKEFVEMFVAEAKMVASLSHPNIAQIFDLGKIDESYYIAMEFVEGRDLRTILSRARARGTPLDVDSAALIAAKVGAALEYAHRHRDDDGNELQIVHRDVSPQNILVSNEGEVKLVDFGIARAAARASHTDSGSLRGKLLVYVARAVLGEGDRQPLGHLLARRRLLRNAHRASLVQRKLRAEHPRAGSRGEVSDAVVAQPLGSHRARGGSNPRAPKRARRSLPERR